MLSINGTLSITAMTLCLLACSNSDNTSTTWGGTDAGSSGSGGNGGSAGGGTAGQGGSSPPGQSLGEPVSGQFHLGPVEWTGSFWNSCGPYPDSISAAEGNLLAGLGTNYNGQGQVCDACIIVETAKGKSAVLRIVTTGQTNEPGDIDVSSAAYALLNSDEYPRNMAWKLVACPDTGPVYYQFQTGANVDWTSFFVRNQQLPLGKVEVKSAKHSSWYELRRGDDSTWNDDGGFGAGAFTIRLTSINGKTLEDTFPSFEPGGMLQSQSGQFK